MVGTKHAESAVRILLGGGIGSGKSVAGHRFGELGAVVVEADRLGHEVLETDGEAFATVNERWPSVVDGLRIDRSALAQIVFGDPEQLAQLEALTHPPIIRRIAELASETGDIVVEVPLILNVPGNWTRVFVDADEGARLRRSIDRGGDAIDVRRRMAAQPSRDVWLKWADHVVDNNGAIGHLVSQIEGLWYRLRTTSYGLQA